MTKRNHCGPSGNGPIVQIIDWLIPDEIYGVYLGECCKEHDEGWSKEANKSADVKFKKCIRCEFAKVGKVFLGKLVAQRYYLGVTIGRFFYKLKD